MMDSTKNWMKIMLKNAEEEEFSLDLSPEDTFGTLRSKLRIKCGIDLDLSQLDLKGRHVSEKDLLGNFLDTDILSDSGLTSHVAGESALATHLVCSPMSTLECLVPGCGKTQGEDPSKNFFVLPTEEERFVPSDFNTFISRLHHWLLVCKREDLLNEQPSSLSEQYVVCEDHFINYHFEDSRKQSLKEDAVPTLFPLDHYSSFRNNDVVGECEVLIREESSDDDDVDEDDDDDYPTDGNIDQLCRLCASSISDVLYIFSEKGKELEIAKKINSCLPITVKSTDPLPKQLCTVCVDKLNLLHEFAENCIQAEDKLRSLNRRKLFKSHPLLPRKSGLVKLFPSGSDVVESNSHEVSTDRGAEPPKTYCCPLCSGGNMTVKECETVSLNGPATVEKGDVTDKCDIVVENDCSLLINNSCNEIGDEWTASHLETLDLSLGDSQETQDGDDFYSLQLDSEHNFEANIYVKFNCRICGDTFESTSLCLDHAQAHFENDFYPCSLCDLCFSTFPSFQTHCEIHQGEPPKVKPRVSKRISCEICGKRFNSDKTLKNHSCGVAPRPFKCEECGKYFLTEVRLLFHQQVHQGGNAITCEYCGKIFSRENNLFDHVRLVHMGEKAHCCDQCGKTFQLKTRLIAHQRVHTGERPFECEICGGKFYDKATLKGHQLTHLEVKPFQCEKCGRCFARKTLFKQHTLAHQTEESKRPRTYCCKLCGGVTFSSYTKLLEHRKEVHPEADMNDVDDSSRGSKPFKCEECGKSFAYRVTLVAHQRNHTGELPFQCEFCSKRFSQKRSLVLHRRTHTGEKPFVCLECGKRFVQSAHLYSHTRLHTGEKPYSCEVCGEAFRLKDVRDAHQRKHTGERPFKCGECGKAFRTSHSYYQHMWIHQGKKPYPCTYCGKAFRRSNGLKIHIRVHTGEKPHSCDVCGRCFAQKQDMKKHRNLHLAGKL